MFDARKFYEKENLNSYDDFNKTTKILENIYNELKENNLLSSKENYRKYFLYNIGFILKLIDLENRLNESYFTENSFEFLLKENNSLFEDIKGINYNNSFTNPSYSVSIFGDKIGQLLSYISVNVRTYIPYAFYHKIYKMAEWNKLIIDLFEYVKDNDIDYDELLKIAVQLEKKDKTLDIKNGFIENFNPEFRLFKDIIDNVDLSDKRYLFRFGKYVTENEIKISDFLLNYPEEKILKLAKQTVDAYISGFANNNVKLEGKETVSIVYYLGQERIIREVLNYLRKNNLEGLINNINSFNPNKQYNYDHRFDNALYFDESYVENTLKFTEAAYENCKKLFKIYSGPIIFETFGEKPFIPENKKECLRLSAEQQKLFQEYKNKAANLKEKYNPRSEISFTIIAFPIPEIGEKFNEIFEKTLEINMLDSKKYEEIQQKIIDVLDKADYVHVKGKNGNKTDIKVKLQKLENPEKESNFANCGADVNIPVGEVFTSPSLKGTNGILHIEETYLEGLNYKDFILKFEDGYIVDYNCANFDNIEDNKKFIQENLLFPHKTLPLGEFAIGTNTLAYVVSKKYNIVNILPILIIEKMGPHFAIGDTCYSFSEDKVVYNPDKKEIKSRDNEKTILRKTNINEAYTYRHTDITLPYESIDFIAAVTEDNQRINIIKDGRFVLKGTEELNKPFEDGLIN